MKHLLALMALALVGLSPTLTQASGKAVNITREVKAVTVMDQGKPVEIERNPDTDNMIDPDYSLTSRPCPPYCIQPMTLAPGV